MNHRQQFGQLCRDLMEQHGIANTWAYQYNDRLRKTLGRCSYRNKLLEFSLPFIDNNPIEILKDTILHEIAHALVGPGHKHGYVWKRQARMIGAVDKSCTVFNVDLGDAPYMFICRCGVQSKFFRRPKYNQRRCKRCNHVDYVVDMSTGKPLNC